MIRQFRDEEPRIQYIKRYRMMIDFRESPFVLSQTPVLPAHYFWIPWHASLTDIHGRVKYLSFRDSMDGFIFPTFRRFDACLNLMRTIASHPGFVSKGTWLIGFSPSEDWQTLEKFAANLKPGERFPIKEPDRAGIDFAATIQGLRSASDTCAIQNVAVRPEFRRLGLGRALMLKSLKGFYAAGARKVTLEVTAGNHPAVNLYESLGFSTYQTVYKESYAQR